MHIMNNLDLSNKVQSVDIDDIAVECACARDKSNIGPGIYIATVGL